MAEILYKNGNLYLDAALYDTYLKTFGSAVLIKRDDLFLLMPVQQASGGLLLKIKNARGDRVIHAVEFFENNGVEVFQEIVVEVQWNSEFHALVFELPDTRT